MKRQSEILRLARENGRVLVDELAEKFQVTAQTVRKDLNELCEQGLLQRIHGGAVISSSVANLRYEARRAIAQEEKRQIGQAAARLIPDGASLFINIGTTTEQVASALTNHHGLLVITNNINVANLLLPTPEIDLIIAGGPVRKHDGGIVGEATCDLVRQFKVDFAVIGVSAIDPDGALLDYDYQEVRVARAIIANARQVILVADATKLSRSAPVRIGTLADIDIFVTDHRLPEPLRRQCDADGVRVVETGSVTVGAA